MTDLTQTISEYKENFERILNENLSDKFFKRVKHYNMGNGWDYFQITIAASDHKINNVAGQFPQRVDIGFRIQTMELTSTNQRITRKPNKEDPREQNLVMVGVKIPFRKPRPYKAAIGNALAKFCVAYKNTLLDNLEMLTDEKIVDYFDLLEIRKPEIDNE